MDKPEIPLDTITPLLSLLSHLTLLVSQNPRLLHSMVVFENARTGNSDPRSIQLAVEDLKEAGILNTVANARAQVVDEVLSVVRMHFDNELRGSHNIHHDHSTCLEVPLAAPPEGAPDTESQFLSESSSIQVCTSSLCSYS